MIKALHRIGFAIVWLLFPLVTQALELKRLWTVQNQFTMPESAVLDTARQFIYVSNVNDYALDDNGFISRVSLDGKSVEAKWLEGLHSPTGLAIDRNKLYVADVNALVRINLLSGKIDGRFPAPDADESPVLNDVAIAYDGSVFVSGSRSESIYRFNGTKLEIWVRDEENLKHANGLFVYGDRLVHGGTHWNAYGLDSRALLKIPSIKPQLQEFDGIARLPAYGYLVSLIDDPRLWLIGDNGVSKPVSEQAINGIDIHFDTESRLLAVPQVGGHLSLFRVLLRKESR